MPWHSPWSIPDATLKIIDALLLLIFRQGLWPCRFLLCSLWLPIRWLWGNAITQSLDYTRCNSQNRWHSVGTLLTLCWISVDALLMLSWRSVDALLTLCWCSFWGVAVWTHTILPIKAANTSIMVKSLSTALAVYKMQHAKLLTLCWRSFADSGHDHVGISVTKNRSQNVDYEYIPKQSPWILQDPTLKIVDILLTLFGRCVDAMLTLCWCSDDTRLRLILRGSSMDTPDNTYQGCQ
jgi:hypothetical protein